jgi:hypothetical protein
MRYWDMVDTQQVPVDSLILRNALMVLTAVLLLGEKPAVAIAETPDAQLEWRPESP